MGALQTPLSPDRWKLLSIQKKIKENKFLADLYPLVLLNLENKISLLREESWTCFIMDNGLYVD